MKTEQWRVRHPEKARLLKRRMLMRQYGLTLDDYDRLLANQGGGCAICGRVKNLRGMSLGVDHDHVTGKVRGILCETCNRAIGLLGDSAQRLRVALAYLEAA